MEPTIRLRPDTLQCLLLPWLRKWRCSNELNDRRAEGQTWSCWYISLTPTSATYT